MPAKKKAVSESETSDKHLEIARKHGLSVEVVEDIINNA